MTINEKENKLKDILKNLGSIAIAFSGGVDSTYLLKIAHDVLKDKAIAVTARSSTFPEREFNEASEFAKSIGAKHIVIHSEELDIEGFAKNPINRCYYCKKELFTKILDVAQKYGISYIADGSNVDDTGDFRPGMQAAKELGVVEPLREANLTKQDIRDLSKRLSLPTWDKPSFACLSSRFPYGHEITRKKLKMVEDAEQFLIDMGFRAVRVRHHEDIARIEVNENMIDKFMDRTLRKKVYDKLKDIGFSYVTLDLKGYRTGSMNEVIKDKI